MSDIMTCMPFGQLMEWVLQEKSGKDTVFGVHRPYTINADHNLTIFERNLETPVGPAAGPHTQLAQNIIASYYAGARFFELKTVQKMDGAELSACVNKPCILADDEGYNCEWSTELTVPDAMSEYIKAWFILHVMAKEFNLGAQDGFQFNISVGYDLEGIKGDKVNTFIDGMMEAKDTAVFQECKKWLLDNADRFHNFTREDIEAIPSNVCNSATISTLHGCPPQEIESIANYLLTEKHLNTFVKCNPTLLGYDFARKTMDEMGYDYMVFGDFHFRDDLQYEDAVPMLTRLMNEAAIAAAKKGHSFIRQKDIKNSFIKVGIGAEKKSKVISEKEKRITAYHEAGHAILFHVLPDMEPVYTISIIPTGMGAAGYTMPLPENDEMFNTKGKMLQDITTLLGGRVAEELIFGDITTGASNDIKRATSEARAMVTKYGMSDKIGLISYGDDR